jgi:hypothetical protein
VLEPCAVKVASTVLRGGIPSNGGVLLDKSGKAISQGYEKIGKNDKKR